MCLSIIWSLSITLPYLQSPCRAPRGFCRSGSGLWRGQGGHLGKTGYDICVIYTLSEAWDLIPGTLVNDEVQILT